MYGLERLGDHADTAGFATGTPITSFPWEEVRGPELAAWASRMEVEHGNFRAALRRSLDQGATEQAARLAG
jgi:hypothetical protein